MPIDEREFSVAYYARPTSPRRGFELGIRVIQKLMDREPAPQVFLFGETSRLSSRIIGFGHRNLGRLEPTELSKLYGRTTFVLSTSFTEMSIVPIEAMACGAIPVETSYFPTRYAGSPLSSRVEFLEDGRNAVVGPPDPELMADKIIAAYADKQGLKRLQATGRKDLETRTLDQAVKALEKLLYSNSEHATGRSEPRRPFEEEIDLLPPVEHTSSRLVSFFRRTASRLIRRLRP